ncbi:MAG: WD repeat-containing protein 63 [Marteilia pararefringens]
MTNWRKISDGKLLSLDWTPQRSLKSGRFDTPNAEVICSDMAGETCRIEKSPFLKGVYIYSTKWNLTIRSTTYGNKAVINIPTGQDSVVDATWSARHPSLFYVAYGSDRIEVWNLQSSFQRPWINQPIYASGKIICIRAISDYNGEGRELLTIGDTCGALNIYKVLDPSEKAFENLDSEHLTGETNSKIQLETEIRDAKLREIVKRQQDLGQSGEPMPNGMRIDSGLADDAVAYHAGDAGIDNDMLLTSDNDTGDSQFDSLAPSKQSRIKKILDEFDSFEKRARERYRINAQ